MENVKEDEFVALMDAAAEYHAQLQELHALLRKGWLAMARHAYQDRANVYKDALVHDRHLRATLGVTHRVGCFTTRSIDPSARLQTPSAESSSGAMADPVSLATAADSPVNGTPTHGSVIDELAAKYGCVLDTVIASDDDDDIASDENTKQTALILRSPHLQEAAAAFQEACEAAGRLATLRTTLMAGL